MPDGTGKGRERRVLTRKKTSSKGSPSQEFWSLVSKTFLLATIVN